MGIIETIEAYKGKRYSIEEYLAFENVAIEKHQYYKGVIFDMDCNIVPDDVVAIISHYQMINGLR